MLKTFSKAKVLKQFVRSESSVDKDKLFKFSRRGRLRYMSDYEIISNSDYPAEWPSTEVPVPDSEIESRKGRRALSWLYGEFKELYNWHRKLVWFDKRQPSMTEEIFIAPNATVIGDVVLMTSSSVWYGAVLKGDLTKITIGAYTNIQDGAIITTSDELNIGDFDPEVVIGSYTTIGHGAKLHACKVGNGCLVGIGATILEGAVLENGSQVAAGSVVPPGRRIPAGEVWAGVPAKFIRKLGKIELDSFEKPAEEYFDLSEKHAGEFTTYGTQSKEVLKIIEHLETVLPKEKETPEEHWKQWDTMGEEATAPFWEGQNKKQVLDELTAKK